MPEENLEGLAGTDVQGASGAAGDPATPTDTSPKSPQGGGADDKPKPRTLAELEERSGRSNFKITPEEARRVQYAARHGITDEDAITKALNESAESGRTAKSDKPAGGEDDLKGDKSGDDSKAGQGSESQSDSKTDDSGDVDSKLLKVIAPHLGDDASSVDDAVKAIKNLQHKLSQQGEFVNAAKEVGITNVDELKQSTAMLKNIDNVISERLKTPEGLKGMYEAYGIKVPDWLAGGKGSSPPASEPSPGESQAPADITKLMEKMEDDGYLGVSDFKKLVPSLIAHAEASVAKRYEGLEDQFKKVGGFVGKLAQESATNAKMTRALADSKAIAENFSRFDDSLALEASPEAIWAASVTPDMQVKKNPHPEFDKLKRILKLRKTALQDAHERSQKLGRTVEPDVLAFLSKQLVTSGGLDDLTRSAKEKAAQRIIANLAKKIQPGVSSKKGSDKSEAFKVPKSVKDVAKMDPASKKALLAKLRSGAIKVEV